MYPLNCAPTATRTRDLLLRRQSLYPLSYRGLPRVQLTWVAVMNRHTLLTSGACWVRAEGGSVTGHDHRGEGQWQVPADVQGVSVRAEWIVGGPAAVHHAWVQANTSPGVHATVEMSSAVCPGVRSNRTEGPSSAPA